MTNTNTTVDRVLEDRTVDMLIGDLQQISMTLRNTLDEKIKTILRAEFDQAVPGSEFIFSPVNFRDENGNPLFPLMTTYRDSNGETVYAYGGNEMKRVSERIAAAFENWFMNPHLREYARGLTRRTITL